MEDALHFLWNLALEQRHIALERWPRRLCAQLLVELDKAWQRCFFKLARAPRFKRKGRDRLGLCEPHPKTWRLDGSQLRFPKLGVLRTVLHRPLEGSPKTCTVARDGDQWFAVVSCEIAVPEPAPRTAPVIALDRGVINLVADSDGNLTPAPAFGERAAKRLARAQRVVSRRQKGSNNREKAKLRVARIQRKVARQRNYFAHTLSTAYAKSHGTVVVEDLRITSMVRANRGLARRIYDSTWGKLVQFLAYKLEWSGGQLVKVPAQYSSQECHACGVVDAGSRCSQADFCCVSCGRATHADLNAALVLRRRANRSVLPGEGPALVAPVEPGNA